MVVRVSYHVSEALAFHSDSNQTHVPELEALAVLPLEPLSFYMFEGFSFLCVCVSRLPSQEGRRRDVRVLAALGSL